MASRPSTPSPSSSATVDDDRAAARAERRRQILAAAKDVFAEAGYHGASINAIIERAQIARGTFYLYFESKAAVFDSILDEAMALLRARIRRIEVDEPGAPPPQLQLHDQLVRTLELFIGDRALATILLSSAKTPEAEAVERLDGFFRELRALIARALEQGLELGIVRPCNIPVTAAALLGMVRGVIDTLVTEPSSQPVEAVVGELIQLALRGLLPDRL